MGLLATAALAFPLITTASAIGLTPNTAHASVPQIHRIGVVDMQRVLLETSEGRKGKKALEKAVVKATAKLERKAEDLERAYEELRGKAAMLSEAELGRRQQELMRQEEQLQELYASAQEKMAADEAVLLQKIYVRASAVMKVMAAAEGVNLVLIRSDQNVLYANPAIDMTTALIAAYEKSL